MNDQMNITEEQLMAYIGRLNTRIHFLEQQLALLQQQIAQSRQIQTNGKEESTELKKKTKAKENV